MEFTIEWFQPSVGTPIVSIADYGIVFNKGAINAMGNPHSVRIGFDREKKLVVVQAVAEEEATDDTLKFAEREKNGFVRINTRDFVRFIVRYCPEIKIDSKAKRFLGRTEGDFFLIDLNTPADGPDDPEDD